MKFFLTQAIFLLSVSNHLFAIADWKLLVEKSREGKTQCIQFAEEIKNIEEKK
jgi:hypothetical protein